MKNKKFFIMAGFAAAATAAAAAVTAYLTTKLWVRTALDREEPKIMKKTGNMIAGSKQDDEFKQTWKAASDRLAEKEHEHVEIVGHDGIKLIGHFFPCENAERVIVAFHGWRSSWHNDYGMISDFWHEHKCSVLYAEQRGQNNSGGDYMGFGLIERYDCIEWINWAICRCGRRIPIYLAGISMGATTVLMASDLELPESVHGIMADCGFTSPKDIWKHVAQNNLHMSYSIRSNIADAICRQKISMTAGEFSTVDALKKTNIPVLLVHGTDDHFVPVEMTYKNYEACASPKRLLVVPGADHAMSYYVDKERYEKSVLDFWKDFDKPEELA
ncbi:MAG: alpha/beta hydrolase [Clostridiales bacterium]|nr:alpha/beta hydrolase [Clostridiales bacterium]